MPACGNTRENTTREPRADLRSKKRGRGGAVSVVNYERQSSSASEASCLSAALRAPPHRGHSSALPNMAPPRYAALHSFETAAGGNRLAVRLAGRPASLASMCSALGRATSGPRPHRRDQLGFEQRRIPPRHQPTAPLRQAARAHEVHKNLRNARHGNASSRTHVTNTCVVRVVLRLGELWDESAQSPREPTKKIKKIICTKDTFDCHKTAHNVDRKTRIDLNTSDVLRSYLTRETVCVYKVDCI